MVLLRPAFQECSRICIHERKMVKISQLVSTTSKGPLLFLSGRLLRLAQEPPFRLFVKAVVKVFPTSIRTRAAWDAVDRPHYLVGALAAADEAAWEGLSEISVVELGVAGGNGLLALEKYAAVIETETGIRIEVYGFDSGGGLPMLCEDYRDHPDQWRTRDFPMDEQALRKRLSKRTTLLIGDVKQTVPWFVQQTQSPPIGFVAVDLDLYSSTKNALQIFLLPGKRMLRRVAMYFDDTHLFYNYKFAGELLAIEEFNKTNDRVKIDRWRGISNSRVFPEAFWLQNMYVAHDIEAISKVNVSRPPRNRGAVLSS